MLILINKQIKLELKQCGFKRPSKYNVGYKYEDSRQRSSPFRNENISSEAPYSFYNTRNRFSHSEVPERNGAKSYLKDSNTIETPTIQAERPHYSQLYEHDANTSIKRPVTADFK